MKITAKEFDEKFEKEDISEFLDFDKVMSVKDFKNHNITLKLPNDIYELIDKEANIIGIKPNDLIKVWIIERLKEIKSL